MGHRLAINSSEAREGEAASENSNPSALGEVSATKMWVLRALAIVLAIQAGAQDLPAPSPDLGRPLAQPPSLPSLNTLPVKVHSHQSYRTSSKNSSPPRKHPAGAHPGGKCPPAAKFFMSSDQMNTYLNATLSSKIQQLLQCKGVDLAGVLGSVLLLLSDPNLFSLLDLSSLLDLGGVGLGSVLGNGDSGKSPEFPSLSKATDAVGDLLPLGQEGLGGLLSGGADNNPIKGLLGGAALSNTQDSLNQMVDKVSDIKESTQDLMKGALSPDVSNALSGLLGNLNLEDLLLGLQVQEVAVENIKSTMAGNSIHVHATAIANIGGKGLAGPVISIVGFQVHTGVTLQISLSTNSTQCVGLEVQETDIQAKKVTLQLVETVTGVLPLSLPLPVSLDDIVSQLLTVELSKKKEEENSCDIDLSDFNDCKNSTGLFTYNIKSAKISPRGLSIFYCAEAHFDKNRVPVPGTLLPPDPKNANLSMILSSKLLKEITAYAAKQSSIKRDNLEAHISKITYAYQPENTIQATYWTIIKKDNESFASGETTLIISHDCKISKDKLIAKLKLKRFEHHVDPPEATEEVQDMLPNVMTKFWSVLTDMLKKWNVPAGVTSYPLLDANVNVIKSNNLQAAS